MQQKSAAGELSMQDKTKKAVLHRWATGKYSIYAIAYGKNPEGPNGGEDVVTS